MALNIETFGTGRIPDAAIEELVNAHFDLRPGAIIRDLRLRRPIYKPTAAYGHFGRTDIDARWENKIPVGSALRRLSVEIILIALRGVMRGFAPLFSSRASRFLPHGGLLPLFGLVLRCALIIGTSFKADSLAQQMRGTLHLGAGDQPRT